MDKKQLSASFRKILLTDVAQNLSCWQSVTRNGWIIKFSIYSGGILLFITSVHTAQTFVRYFIDENAACTFINKIITKSPKEELNIK